MKAIGIFILFNNINYCNKCCSHIFSNVLYLNFFTQIDKIQLLRAEVTVEFLNLWTVGGLNKEGNV